MSRVKNIEDGYKAAMRDLDWQRRGIESRYAAVLSSLTKDELLEIAEACGAESGEDHCYRCKAWYMWVELNEDS